MPSEEHNRELPVDPRSPMPTTEPTPSDDSWMAPAGPGIDTSNQGISIPQRELNSQETEAALEAIASPRHLHPSSLVFDVISHGRNYLVPLLFGLFGAASGDVKYLIISALIFVPAVMVSVFRYFTLRYRIEEKHLVVTQGLVFRQMRKVPVRRIQNVDLVQNLLHRLLGVAEVRIETASGTEPEATLRVLSMQQLELLRQAIFAERRLAQKIQGSDSPISGKEQTGAEDESIGLVSPSRAALDAAGSTPVLRISLRELILAGLASNRGLVMFGIAVGAYFQFADDSYSERFSQLYDMLPANLSQTALILASVVIVIAGLLLLRLLGIGWYILRFFNYRLDRRGDDLRISCGLFTRVSATVPRRRIQFISVHRPLIMRWLNLASIRIETAGGSGDQENATQSVSKRWFVPVIPEHQVAELVEVLRPGLKWSEDQFVFHGLAERAFSRMLRLALIESVLIGAVGMAVTRPWGFLAGVIALPLLLIWTRRQSRSMRYARSDLGVVYRSGVINRKISVTFFDKIQAMRMDQSPFDRRWSMARLSIDTAAAGPAGHVISVPYLDIEFAQREFAMLRSRTGKSQPVFE